MFIMQENGLAAGALPRTPTWGAYSSPRTPSWWGGGSLLSNLTSSSLAPCNPKSLYRNSPMIRTLTDCLMLVLRRIRAGSTVCCLSNYSNKDNIIQQLFCEFESCTAIASVTSSARSEKGICVTADCVSGVFNNTPGASLLGLVQVHLEWRCCTRWCRVYRIYVRVSTDLNHFTRIT